MKSKQTIVTGGAGFIGSHLVGKLVKAGHKVTIYDNLSTGKKEFINPKAQFIKTDLSKPVKFVPADIVFHLAALPRIDRSFDHPLTTHEANVTATLNVLNASIKAGIKRFIFTSSSSVYGKIKTQDLPVKETHPTTPESPYASQKLMSEIYIQLFTKRFNLNSTILRLFNVYGKRMPTTGAYKLVLPIFLEQKKQNKPLTIFGDGKQTRDFTYISDVTSAIVKAMHLKRKLKAEIINIGSGKPTSILELAKLIGGKTRFIKPNPRSSWEERHKYANISKAKSLLNWKPLITIEDGLKYLDKII